MKLKLRFKTELTADCSSLEERGSKTGDFSFTQDMLKDVVQMPLVFGKEVWNSFNRGNEVQALEMILGELNKEEECTRTNENVRCSSVKVLNKVRSDVLIKVYGRTTDVSIDE